VPIGRAPGAALGGGLPFPQGGAGRRDVESPDHAGGGAGEGGCGAYQLAPPPRPDDRPPPNEREEERDEDEREDELLELLLTRGIV